MLLVLLAAALVGVARCDAFADAATRTAYALAAQQKRLGREAGSVLTVQHGMTAKAGDCAGPYTVQFDQIGLIVVWCEDDQGRVVASHSTSYHRRFVDTARTFIVWKPAGSALLIRLERRQRNGRPVITHVS